jgi:hypothetical protein
MQPFKQGIAVIGYRINYPTGEFMVVYKSQDRKAFMAWDVAYATFKKYPIDGYMIIPLY